MSRNGILCLEGDWEEGLIRKRSVVPVIELVRSQWDVPFIHRTASTRDEFRMVIEEWLKARYSRYPILYLGFHGQPGALEIGREVIPINDLFEFAGKGNQRVIHFGACKTLSGPAKEIRQFLKMTRFVGICGFQEEVDWLQSCALEILILEQLSRRQVTAGNIRVFRSALNSIAGSLVKSLGFKIWDRTT